MGKRIPFNKPFIVGKELYNIACAVMEGHLSGDGHYSKMCHRWLEEHLGCQRGFLTHSCTSALEMAAILSVGQGDEVIMPSFTFVSTANAFVLRGATPVFVDIRKDTFNLDERLIESAITEKTRAIVPVHYAGVACEMDEIMAIAARRSLTVIEDAAQALLSTYHGRHLGAIGHLGCLSFHETKNVICGEGGALLVNDERFIERAEIIREKGTNRSRFFRGQVDKYTWVDIGSSYLPSELLGAFLYAQLEQANEINKARSWAAEKYRELLQPLADKGLIGLPYLIEGNVGNGHMFYITMRSLSERTDLIAHLKAHEISAVFHYVPLHSSPAGRQYCRFVGDMNVTNSISDRLLRLPLYYGIKEDDIERIADSIHRYFRDHVA